VAWLSTPPSHKPLPMSMTTRMVLTPCIVGSRRRVQTSLAAVHALGGAVRASVPLGSILRNRLRNDGCCSRLESRTAPTRRRCSSWAAPCSAYSTTPGRLLYTAISGASSNPLQRDIIQSLYSVTLITIAVCLYSVTHRVCVTAL
jgi:hypothetical protein